MRSESTPLSGRNDSVRSMVVRLTEELLERYERFSLYNSPYPAHTEGRAIDLYPGEPVARSPVEGEVMATRTVRCPRKPFAREEDYLILIDCGDTVARILHVEPHVERGTVVSMGDPLGTLVRSGFFAQWVDNHIHLGFRDRGQHLERASGSRRLELDVDVTPVEWDGTGVVVETGPTHVRLDSPSFEGDGFAAVSTDCGLPLDGGMPHYAGGGILSSTPGTTVVSLLGSSIGESAGRDLSWLDFAVKANTKVATGLSLVSSRIGSGCTVVFHEGHDFAIGDRIEVEIEPTSDPIRLGQG